MKTYKEQITLVKNNRGCYILDTIKGCSVCFNKKPNGCYGNCYAKNIASRYGFEFSKPIKRDMYFDDNQLYLFNIINTIHYDKLIKKINNINMPFIRIGEMGDPSEDWSHTINICKAISDIKKPIVIITKHWNTISNSLLKEIEKLNICINTSISALDNNNEIKHRLKQYNILKNNCNSVLRIVSCDFNRDKKEGNERAIVQEKLFSNNKIIDTIFRPNINNPLVLNKIINIKKVKFIKSYVWASVFNDKTYLGNCLNCPDMCGIKLWR
jgi:hypothetical protein